MWCKVFFDWLRFLLEVCIGKGRVSWQYNSLVQDQLKAWTYSTQGFFIRFLGDDRRTSSASVCIVLNRLHTLIAFDPYMYLFYPLDGSRKFFFTSQVGLIIYTLLRKVISFFMISWTKNTVRTAKNAVNDDDPATHSHTQRGKERERKRERESERGCLWEI